MNIAALHIGMKVRHPQYGVGTIKALTELTADVRFDDGIRTLAPETSDLGPAEPQAEITHLARPLSVFVTDVVQTTLDRLGVEKPQAVVGELGARWHRGKMVLHPSDPTLQTKEVELEVFFHKVVMVRNNLRVLEQKLNAHEKLNEGEKIELQQYLTRCYGSLTTFNLLFKEKESQF
jgi:hypothetical protein